MTMLLASLLLCAALNTAPPSQSTAPVLTNPIVVVDSVDLSDYAGTYKGPAGGQVDQAEIVVKDGKLFATAAGITTELMATGTPDVYTESQYGAVITFLRDENKRVNRLQLVVDQMTLNVTMIKQ